MKNDKEMDIRMFAYDVRFAITHTKTVDESTGEITLFIPYTVLRLRPKLRPNIGQKLTEKELTEFVEETILVLKQELSDGYLTEREFDDYIKLFRMAADRVLAKHSQMRREVDHMIGPIIKLPSMIEDELREKLIVEYDAKYEAEYRAKYDAMYEEIYKDIFEEQKAALLEKDAALADMDAALAEKDAEIHRLQDLVRQLDAGKPVS